MIKYTYLSEDHIKALELFNIHNILFPHNPDSLFLFAEMRICEEWIQDHTLHLSRLKLDLEGQFNYPIKNFKEISRLEEEINFIESETLSRNNIYFKNLQILKEDDRNFPSAVEISTRINNGIPHN